MNVTQLAPIVRLFLNKVLFAYLSESFGNMTRVDHGTVRELNFIVFTMGLVNLVDRLKEAIIAAKIL